MAATATIYRFTVELSDVDRGVYESLSFRVACHPSEGSERLVCRVLAYLLHYSERLEFGRGISDAEEAAIWEHDLTGQLLHWIDVGTPTPDRVHLAGKKSKKVTVVCHKGEAALSRELSRKKVYRAEEVDVILLDPQFVGSIAQTLPRNVDWTVVLTDDGLTVSQGEENFTTSLRRIPLPQP